MTSVFGENFSDERIRCTRRALLQANDSVAPLRWVLTVATSLLYRRMKSMKSKRVITRMAIEYITSVKFE